MNVDRLHEILSVTTIPLRTGDPVTREDRGGLTVTTINVSPHVEDARSDLELIDLLLLTVGVDKVKAEENRQELIALLRSWPDPGELRDGPSYIAVGGTIGSQEAAFRLFAVGKVLGLWNIITMETFGASREEALERAGLGWVMISGFRGENYPGVD